MKYFLAKTDPQTYSINDLEREKETLWEGVKNPQAKIFLREMKKGDRVLIYHSGEGTIVGLAQVSEEGEVPKFKFIKKFEEPFVNLKQIKESKKFTNFRLVRQGRLSVMDVPVDYLPPLLSILPNLPKV
jgi:predicted RNA-binding protein with PUA-like domain